MKRSVSLTRMQQPTRSQSLRDIHHDGGGTGRVHSEPDMRDDEAVEKMMSDTENLYDPDIWKAPPHGKNIDETLVDHSLYEYAIRKLMKTDMKSLKGFLREQSIGRVGFAFKVAVQENSLELFRFLLELEEYKTYKTSLLPANRPLVYAARFDNYHFVHILIHDCKEELRAPDEHEFHGDHYDAAVWEWIRKLDPLRKGIIRLSVYMALTSPTYLITTENPIKEALVLQKRIQKIKKKETDFNVMYSTLEDKCTTFMSDMLDQCENEQEVRTILQGCKLPSLALDYDSKKFLAHPIVQHHLWHEFHQFTTGHEGLQAGHRSFLMHLNPFIFSLLWIPIQIVLFPVYIWYGFALPLTEKDSNTGLLGQFVNVPVIKYYGNTSCYLIFLLIILLSSGGEYNRPHSKHPETLTAMSVCILIYVLGHLWNEIKQIRHGGKSYFSVVFNWFDLTLLGLYLAAIGSRIFAIGKVMKAHNMPSVNFTQETYYYLQTDRSQWHSADPIVIADGLFAMANLVSFLRLTSVLNTHAFFGPMLSSFGFVFVNVVKFLLFFILILLAFLIFFIHIHWYFVDAQLEVSSYPDRLVLLTKSLFLDAFTIPADELVQISQTVKQPFIDFLRFITYVSFRLLFAVALLNMLIALLVKTFYVVWDAADVEWKYARAKLWLEYIQDVKEGDSPLPTPFNLLSILRMLIKTVLSKVRRHRQGAQYQSAPDLVNDQEHKDELLYELVKDKLICRFLKRKAKDMAEKSDDDESASTIHLNTIMHYSRKQRSNLSKNKFPEKSQIEIHTAQV